MTGYPRKGNNMKRFVDWMYTPLGAFCIGFFLGYMYRGTT